MAQDAPSAEETATPQTQTSTEAALSALWSDILDQPIGAQDRFIDFTDSLSAMEYVNRVRSRFHVEIPVTALFDSIPTVSKLAELIDRAASTRDVTAGRDVAPAPARAATSSVARERSSELAVMLPGGRWRVWRTVALRGAGFPAAMMAPLAVERTTGAADRFVDARHDVIERRATVLHELGTLIREAPDATTRADLRRTRRRIRQGVVRADGPLASESALAAALSRRSAAYTALAAAYDADAELVNTRLMDILADRRFREAALWQNRTALGLASARLRDPRRSAGDRKNAAAFIAMLAQRYAVKNDSLGFFGPVGWARFSDDVATIDVTPGPGLLARRQVYFEGWAIDALADALDQDPALTRWTAPRIKSGVVVDADRVYAPVSGPVTVGVEQRRLMALCDGSKSAHEIAAAALAATPPIADSEPAVFDMLRGLVDLKVLAWRLEVPSQLHPERALADALVRIGDPALRARCEDAWHTIVDARDRIEQAAGDDGALEPALADLDAAFTRITGRRPSRRAGEMYAARGLVFEDCRRDCDVAFGNDFLARLGPPLSIVLDGARWVSVEMRRAFTGALRASLAQVRAALGTETVDAHLLMNYVGAKGRELTEPISRTILEQFQERWRWILSGRGDERRWIFSVAGVESRAQEAFAASGASSWCGYFAPDVMIASPSLEQFRQGRFHAVLGEVHSNNTLLWSALVSQHPHIEQLLDTMAADVGDQTVVLMQTPKARWVSRLNVTTLPAFWRYEHGDDLPSLPVCRSLPAASLVAFDDGQSVRLRTRDGSLEFDAYDLFAVTMSYEADRIVSAMLRTGPHSSRVTIGDLTVSREQWQSTPSEMPFVSESDPCRSFAKLREWAREQGMPRHVFYKSPGETKPCYLDFDSPLYAGVFTKLMRRLRGDATVRLVEMLPALGDTWLIDREGAGYTSEIRIVARRGS